MHFANLFFCWKGLPIKIIVQKFGGSSVRDAARLRRACEIIAKARAAGYAVVAVFSAQGDTTDELLARAQEITSRPSQRELDALLATGECVSVALGAMMLEELGLPALSLTGWQAGIRTDGTHGGANILALSHERIRRELERGNIVLVAGFQGVDAAGDITTLGRGGSDTSAVALAACLDAELCQIYTDVEGVYTTDPRICPAAQHLTEVSCDQMLRLAAAGAQVLHDRSVALAKKHGVELQVLGCTEGSRMTRISPLAAELPLTGLTKAETADGLVCLTAVGAALPNSILLDRMCEVLSDDGVWLKGVEQGENTMSVLVERASAERALRLVHAALFETS